MAQYSKKKMKTVNHSEKKKRKEICRSLQQRDTLAVLSLRLYNFYLKSNAYVVAWGNIHPAARQEIKIIDVKNRLMYL